MKHNDNNTKSFPDKVRALPGGEHMDMCYSCGTCVSKCVLQKRIDPAYNPRRLINKAIRGYKEDSFDDITTWLCSGCDLCYAACPQEIHISEVIHAIRQLAIEDGHASPLQSAKVNEKTCVACGLCVAVCPYEAIELVTKSVPGRGRNVTVAQVDANQCMACGLCAAGCRSNSIELEEAFSSTDIVEELHGWLEHSPIEEVIK